jgi:hypothetical protein
MLSIAVLAYVDHDPSELCEGQDVGKQREALWSQYVSAVVSRDYDLAKRDQTNRAQAYSEEEVRRWLGWLATEMT